MTTERDGEQLEQLEPGSEEVSASPPMPEIARAAARDALGALEEPAAGGSSSSSPPAGRPRRGKKKGRTRRDLVRENRELAARLAELNPPAPGPEASSSSSSSSSTSAGEEPPAVITTRPAIDVTSAQMFAYSFVAFVFAALANERGDHWKLKEEDRSWTNHLGEGLAPFLPNLGVMLPWLLGGMGMVNAIQARASIDKQIKAGGRPHEASAPSLTIA